MTSTPPSRRTAAPAAGSLRCPKCSSSNVRASRHNTGGLLRRMLHSDYRCRDCYARFSRLDFGVIIIAGATALVVAIGFAGGWMLRERHETDRQQANEQPADPPPGEQADRGYSAGRTGGGAPTGEPELAAPDTSTILTPGGSQGLGEMAEGGQAQAQFSLGMNYLNGSGGFAKDAALAFKWFERSAQQGYAEAQYALGSMYLAGRGALQNFESAYEWFDKAAQQNHAEAQYRLGILYRTGHGVAIDKARSYVWFNLAAAQGHERAAEARDSLLSSMNAEQLARAQRESREWKPAAGKP